MQVNLEQQKNQGTRPMKSKRERGRGRLYLGLLLPHGWASSRERSLTPPLPTSSWCRCVVSWRLAASIGVLRSPAAQHEHHLREGKKKKSKRRGEGGGPVCRRGSLPVPEPQGKVAGATTEQIKRRRTRIQRRRTQIKCLLAQQHLLAQKPHSSSPYGV